MKRKLYNKILEWKETDKGQTALLIDGARRVGKSYIAEAFAKAEYKSYILIDFNRASKEIKYLVADSRYDYIETGSLMTIKKNVQDILIPSEERHMKMFPFDFEEFLWALGNETIMDYIRNRFNEKKPVGQAFHRKAMDYFRQYLIVGGMPQAVAAYVEGRDFDRVDRIKRDILELYRADIMKHAAGYEMKVAQIFDDIPAQLQKHDKKFKLSSLKKEARYREYEDALFWLNDAMIVNICYNSTEPNIGLRLNMDRLRLKCYMADTGLLISHAFDENGIVSEEIYKKLLFDKLEVNKGMIVENIVAQMLAASGHKLYFYTNSSREDAASRMKIDFLIAKSKISTRHNISPRIAACGLCITWRRFKGRKWDFILTAVYDTAFINFSQTRKNFIFLSFFGCILST